MYPLRSKNVYMHRLVADTESYRERAERVIAALEAPPDIHVFDDADLPDLLAGGIAAKRKPMGTLETVADPDLLFHTFRFDGRNAERMAAFAGTDAVKHGLLSELLGHRAFHWANYNLEGDPHRHDKVCRPCWRIHLQNGCVHQCQYCSFGGLLVSAVNVEETCDWLGEIIGRHPWQKTYLLDDDADPPCLEPELGVLSDMIEWFGTLDQRYVIIHTKTWNTSWMTDLDHRGNTIIVWSISGRDQSRLLEPVTGTTEQRVEAARVAQEAGYQIRYKFKPIIPVKDWRADAEHAVKLLFERTDPDVISLCCFMWMDIDELLRRLPREELDEAFVAAAEAKREAMAGTRARPFPPEVREEIYTFYLNEIRRWNADIPVSISTENFAMWKTMGPKLGYTARSYPCGCGPMTVPGAPPVRCDPFTAAVRMDNGEIPSVYPPFPAA